MTTWREPERTATLIVDEGPFAGAEISVRLDIALGVYEDLLELMARREDETPAEQRARYRSLCELVGSEILRGWNVVDHRDRPRPATAEGLRRVNPAFVGEILYLFVGALSAPLAEASPPSSAGEATPRARRRRK